MKSALPVSLLLWLALLPAIAAAMPISEIRFEGNEVTRESVLRQELLLQEGDEADSGRIEASRQAMMDLGLFKTVTSHIEEVEGGKRVTFTVEERYYILPIPLIDVRLKEDDIESGVQSYHYGLELRFDNIMGLNQQLKLNFETEESPQAGASPIDKVSLYYRTPRLVGTEYQFAFRTRYESGTEQEFDGDTLVGSFHKRRASNAFYISRWLKPKWISHGWTVGAGLSSDFTSYTDATSPAVDYQDSLLLSINTGLHYDGVHEHPYHREGGAYGYGLSIAAPDLGSDYSYTRHQLYYRRYQPLQAGASNLNTQLQFGTVVGSGYSYNLDNSALLRGYDDDYVEGSTMLLLNTEYHHNIGRFPQLRGVLFVDVGNAWEELHDMDITQLHVGTGVGLRWKVQSFVDLTLRIDYGHGIDSGTNKFTLTTNASF